MRPAFRLLLGALLALGVAGFGACAGARRHPPAPVPATAASPAPEPETPQVKLEAPAPLEPVTPAERQPPVLRPAARPALRRLPVTVRIGLLTDLESVTLPCCDGDVVAELPGRNLDLVSPVTVRPAAAAVSPTVWRLQAAAIRDERPATEMARRLTARTGETADARFDAKSGLYRVRVGGWPTREAAEQAGRRLRTMGLESAWVVAEGGGVESPALDIVHRGQTLRLTGRRFVVRAPPGGGLRVEGHRYRGAIVVFLNDRGRLNVVNELGLEDYLRGVVPRELGPGAYPEIEALKAQAVAARSYTLRNLGGFEDEAYDLCGTPQCQVYGGMDVEHPLSDRAVAETAGEVVTFRGEIADALYSATCGGHTENVEVVFPLRSAEYLRGVPCIEAGGSVLSAGDQGGAVWPDALLARLMSQDQLPAGDASSLERALRAVVRRAGVPAPEDHLRSLDRREVQRFLASLLDLAADIRFFVRSEELDYLVADPPAEWSGEDRRFAAWLAKSRLLYGVDRASAVSTAEARELVLRVALLLRVVELRTASFSTVGDAHLTVREAGAEHSHPLRSDLLVARREAGWTAGGSLLLVAGDTLELYLGGDRLLAVVQQVDPRGTAFDRTHERSTWSRFRSDAELAALVRARYPGFDLERFEVMSRGVSGRVGKLRLFARGGETIDLEGLAIRWTFDLPDTLFTARRLSPAGGKSGWKFSGRGWGHGVGMCQTGAFGMARRGYDYRTILTHYYTGVDVERLTTLPVPAPGGRR